MTPQRKKALREALLALRTEVSAKAPERIEPNRKDPASVGVADEDEQALSEMLQTLASQKNRQQADILARIDRALRRFADAPDEVGTCEECGEDIAPKRLSLMPYAVLCLECQSARDPKRGQTRRGLTDFK